MTENLTDVLALVRQVMEICAQTGTRAEALESLLLRKGVVTEAELQQEIAASLQSDKKLAESLGSGHHEA